jgi:hypothetical protein
MDDRNIRRFNRATRIQSFGLTHAGDFAASSRATQLFMDLALVIYKLNDARVGQHRDPVGKPALLQALSADFKDIARTARAIKLDDPAFPAASYRHPDDTTETQLTTHADRLLELLEDNTDPEDGDTPAELAAKAELRAKFIDYELSENFVLDLRLDRNAIDVCNSGKHSDNLEGVASTSAIETLLAQAQTIITRLDAAVKNKFRDDPDKLAAWKSASHVERDPKKAAAPAPTAAN